LPIGGVGKLNIKKVDDKLMVIHTKEKTKIHLHENPEIKIQTESIYTAKSEAIINGSTAMSNKMNIRRKFRKAVFNDKGKINHRKQYRSVKREQSYSIAKNDKSIKLANIVAIKAAFYSWNAQGINLTYEGAYTVAQEAKYCYDNGIIQWRMRK